VGESALKNNQNEVKRITIKDVAEAAGVSIATVSRILNGQEGVSGALAAQVQAAVANLNYQPNGVARALKNRKSRSIGLIIPDIENPFFPALVRGVEDAAQRSGYALILCNTDGRGEEETKYIKFLLSKQVDGILFAGNLTYDEWRKSIPANNVPVVLVDRRMEGAPFDTVVVNNRLGAFMAVEHLICQGRRRIATIAGRVNSPNGRERLEGYAQALKYYGYEYREQFVHYGQFTFESGYQATEELLNSGREFDALFAANDLMAIGAIECLLKNGRRIPDDVAVAGFDNIRMAGWYKPSLTTVSQPVYKMGQMAMELIVKNSGKNAGTGSEVIIQPELVIRGSSGGREGEHEQESGQNRIGSRQYEHGSGGNG
jgi:LacI family transcriptional regulator